MFTQKRIISVVLILFVALTANTVFAQKVGFVSSEDIRSNFPEAKRADQRIQTIVEDWKRELEQIEANIGNLEFEIKKNRLVWSDEERLNKEKELEELRMRRLEFARQKFEEGGEYDFTVKTMYRPIETKIYAAVHEVAAEEGFDMVFDKSVHPIPYTNFKYDLTIKVLRKLGVDVDELEKQLQEKIEKDPRNKVPDKKDAPRRRSRSRSTKPAETENTEEQPARQENPTGEEKEKKTKDPREIRR